MLRVKAHRAGFQGALLSGLCALTACIPDAGPNAPAAQTGFCVRPSELCTPDPGPRPVNCAAAEEGIEFAPFMIADFEDTGNFVYSYTDGTAQVAAFNGGTPSSEGYSLARTTASRCDSQPTDNVLHFAGWHVDKSGYSVAGVPFLGWGGGVGVSMKNLSQGNKGLCPWGDTPMYDDFCPPADEDTAVSTTTLDLRNWDGVAVWARRSPDSQPLLRVLVGNKYTDDDVSFLQYGEDPTKPRYCERVRECVCVNGKDCLWSSTGTAPNNVLGYYCGDPMVDYSSGLVSIAGAPTTNSCNVTHCNEPYPAYGDNNKKSAITSTNAIVGSSPTTVPTKMLGTDPQFYGRACTPYAFRGGMQSSYCFDPGRDPPPAEGDQQCGDHWTSPLNLTTEWQLFLVPFTSMYQQGWAKRWDFFDTSSVSVVRLTWDAGWGDYWIDNLRFYRVRR